MISIGDDWVRFWLDHPTSLWWVIILIGIEIAVVAWYWWWCQPRDR
jgi:hypothetical protein